MKKIITLFLAIMMLVSPFEVLANSFKIDYSTIVLSPALQEAKKNIDTSQSTLLYPPKRHPYIYLNEDFIKFVKENKDSDDIKYVYDELMKLALRELPEEAPEYISTLMARQLEARAFMYALGEFPKSYAEETVEFTIDYLQDVDSHETYYISRYKDFGTNGIQVGAYVFDWCYDVMTPSQKIRLADAIRVQMDSPEQPCYISNIDQWTDIAANAVGMPLIYMSIGACAIYELYPEVYETIMGRVQGTMADIMRVYGQSGSLSDGSMAYSREYYSYYIELLFERMGHHDFYGDQQPIGYKMIYSFLPYGGYIKQGDDYGQQAYKIGTYCNRRAVFYAHAFLGNEYNNPYFKHQYYKVFEKPETLDALLTMYDIDNTEAKLPDDLPLAYYVSEPKSEILARTSWQDGMNSPAVVGYMNMNNRRTGDHDHAHIGDFQMYYKGPLTMPAGVYNGEDWGDNHYFDYLTRSISANCMTVYDSREVYVVGANNIRQVNDGGQKLVHTEKGFVIGQYKDNMADSNIWATTQSHYIGPNEMTPAFSYIKGDITNAYSKDKMQQYNRSMVFMDTFNETYPGAMVVFDRVVSTNAKMPKKWLLQCVTRPTVIDNQITIVNTDEGCNGKLVNTTIYPKNPTIEVVGDIGTYMADGRNCAPRAAVAALPASPAYKGGIRCEVSPSEAAKEDIFLNAMYVTDADGNAPNLPMIEENTDLFVGVTMLDRTVLFSKSANVIGESFKFNVRDNGYDEMMCLITDMAAGKWTVSGGGKTVILEATEDGNSITFKGVPGEYVISPAEEEAEISNIQFPQMEKGKTGDFAIEIGIYTYVEHPNKLVNGEPYFAVADFAKDNLGATVLEEGNKVTITTVDKNVITLTAGDKNYQFKNDTENRGGTMEFAPFMDGDVMYINYKGIAEDLGFEAHWNKNGIALECKIKEKKVEVQQQELPKLSGVDESRVLWPVEITCSSSDKNVPAGTIDRNLGTRWSSLQGDGEWMCHDLGEVMDVSAVQIAWYNGAIRTWKFDIQISDNGREFTDIITGGRSGGVSGVETFSFPQGTKARYIRYVGHGEEVTQSLNNSVLEFIILK